MRIFVASVAVAFVVASTPSNAAESVVTTTTAPSSTLRSEFTCTGTLRVFDPIDLTRLNLRVAHYSECRSAIAGAKVTRQPFPPFGWVLEDLPPGFRGPADVMICTADLFAEHECQLDLEEGSEIAIYSAEGPAGPLVQRPTVCAVSIDCDLWPCDPPGPYYAAECGDADGNRILTALDALIVLRAAVSLGTCASIVCDTDRDASIDAADALNVLRAAVGLPVSLACPAPCTNEFP